MQGRGERRGAREVSRNQIKDGFIDHTEEIVLYCKATGSH